MSELKLCRDCRYFMPKVPCGGHMVVDVCSKLRDPVYGVADGNPHAMRERFGLCGEEGRLFEPKPAQPRPWWRFWE